jgi:hypothetical protein
MVMRNEQDSISVPSRQKESRREVPEVRPSDVTAGEDLLALGGERTFGMYQSDHIQQRFGFSQGSILPMQPGQQLCDKQRRGEQLLDRSEGAGERPCSRLPKEQPKATDVSR